MSARSQIEKKIQAKQQEIADAQAGIEKAEAYVQALQEVLRLLPKEDEGQPVEHLLRHGSAVSLARDLLTKAGKPMHITAILEGIGKQNTKPNRLSVSGSLRNYARKGQIFTQEGGNIFGLVTFKSSSNGHVKSTPPKGFGLDRDEEEAA